MGCASRLPHAQDALFAKGMRNALVQVIPYLSTFCPHAIAPQLRNQAAHKQVTQGNLWHELGPRYHCTEPHGVLQDLDTLVLLEFAPDELDSGSLCGVV